MSALRSAGCVILAVLSGASPRPGESHFPLPTLQHQSLEQRVHDLVNRHRASRRLAPLDHSVEIAEIARTHSRAMAGDRAPLGHRGFEARADTIRQRIGFSAVAENVALNDYPEAATVDTAVAGWLRSRGHRENIEGDYAVTGVGVVRDGRGRGTFFYTQIFVRR
ncbi:MAG: CAP domain-containing protein [Gemmatimonadales bacterium]